jgi:hypothetical protein
MGAGIDAQAQAHYNRVIADGGLIPSGLVGVNNFFTTVKGIYGTSDITTAISVGLDAQVLGYKLGAGAGTTAGQAAQKLYSCSGSSGDVVQTTAASQPLLLVHSGANYWFGSGVAGNYVSTPNAAANQITGDIEFVAKVNFQDSGNQDTIFIKSDAVAGSSFCYSFWKNGNSLALSYSNGGTVGARVISQSSATLSSVGYTYGTDIWVKGSRSASTGDVNFYYGSNGTNWTQLGTTQTTTAQSIFNASIPLWIGDWANILNQFKGKIYRAIISNSIGGAPVVDFNPSQYNAATSQTQWTSSTGEVWSIQTGTATTGYKGVLVDRTIVQGDGIDDTLDLNTFILPQPFTIYPAFNNIGDTSNGFLFDAVNTSSNRVLMIRDGGLNFSYETTPSSGAVAISRTVKTLELNSVVFNGASSSVQRNNGSSVIGNIGSSGFTSLRLGRASGSGGSNGNYVYNTFIIVSSADNSTIRTSMYNYIRSINNNAF